MSKFQKVRRRLSRFIMWQWKKMSHLSAKIYNWLVRNGVLNGKDKDED